MKALVPLFLAVIVALASCNGLVGRGDGDDNRFSAFADIPADGWLYTAPIEFEPDTLHDSIVPAGTLLVSVRHGKNYLYRNLWLEVCRHRLYTTCRHPRYTSCRCYGAMARTRHGAVDGSARHCARKLPSGRTPVCESASYYALRHTRRYRTRRSGIHSTLICSISTVTYSIWMAPCGMPSTAIALSGTAPSPIVGLPSHQLPVYASKVSWGSLSITSTISS